MQQAATLALAAVTSQTPSSVQPNSMPPGRALIDPGMAKETYPNGKTKAIVQTAGGDGKGSRTESYELGLIKSETHMDKGVVTDRVSCWKNSEQRQRWVATSLAEIE